MTQGSLRLYSHCSCHVTLPAAEYEDVLVGRTIFVSGLAQESVSRPAAVVAFMERAGGKGGRALASCQFCRLYHRARQRCCSMPHVTRAFGRNLGTGNAGFGFMHGSSTGCFTVEVSLPPHFLSLAVTDCRLRRGDHRGVSSCQSLPGASLAALLSAAQRACCMPAGTRHSSLGSALTGHKGHTGHERQTGNRARLLSSGWVQSIQRKEPAKWALCAGLRRGDF